LTGKIDIIFTVFMMVSSLKDVIIFLDTDKHASAFDLLTASNLYPDAQILYYSNVEPSDARKIIQDAMFPRGPEGAKKTKIFIGGYDVEKADQILGEAKKAMFKPFELGIIVDPRGASTTGSAVVAKALALYRKHNPSLKGVKATVLAATGPVGKIATYLLASEGISVIATSRSLEKARALAEKINLESKTTIVQGVKGQAQDEVGRAIQDSEIIIAAGAAGAQLLSLETLKRYGSKCKVVADVNAVPPTGVEGLKATDDGVEFTLGVRGIGALAIGASKNKIEAELFRRAIDLTKGVFDHVVAYEISKSLLLSKEERISEGATRPKFGIEFVPEKAVDKIIDWVKAAENGGFDNVWVTDHYNNRNTYILLTAVALATKTITIGTGVTNPFHINPAWTASAIATLDELSGNRAILGLGPGDVTTLRSLGITSEKPLTAMKECVEIIKKLWNGETIQFDGKVFSMKGARLNYKPKRTPPVYMGAQGPKLLELAGTIADGVLINAAHPRDFKFAVEQIKKGLQTSGRDKSKVDIVAYASVSIDYEKAKAREKAKEVVAFIVAGSPPEVLKRHDIPQDSASNILASLQKGRFGDAFNAVTDQMLDSFSICGRPSDIVDKIDEILKIGVTQIVVGSPIGPNKADAIYMISKDVLPHFR
jgi:5,10-methylenetetrahydromethanopterin reductase